MGTKTKEFISYINIIKMIKLNIPIRKKRTNNGSQGFISRVLSNALGKFLGTVLFWCLVIVIFYFFGEEILYFLLYVVENMI